MRPVRDRRRGRRVRRRADELRPARRARAPQRPGVPLRVRHRLARRPGRPRAAAAHAQAAAARRARLPRRRAADAVPQRGGRGALRGGVPEGLGGRGRQARRQPVPRDALQGLAEVQVRARPGARDRRVHGAEGLAHRVRRAAARLPRRRGVPLRRQGRDRLRPRDAARPRRADARARPRRPAVHRRRADPRARHHLGRARARRPGRRSPSGPGPDACATRASSGCATTRPRARSSARV